MSGKLESEGRLRRPALWELHRGGRGDPITSTPAQIYWDESIGLGEWPPPDWELPRVTVTRWETDM